MTNRLSKSRFQTGLQCELALWRTRHEPELADPIGEQQQHIFDTGTAVGELARELFPDGVLVAEDHTQSQQALETTRTLMADPPPIDSSPPLVTVIAPKVITVSSARTRSR